MNKELLKGITQVSLGAVSYGLLATIVELAYQAGYTTAEVTISQYLLGLVAFGIGSFLVNRKQKLEQHDNSQYIKLILGGSFIGLTGVFYYFAVLHLPVSISVVLLMQSIWMGVVLDGFLSGKLPCHSKSIAVVIVLVGTLLATNALANFKQLSLRGILWGLAAAMSYTIAMASANRISKSMNVVNRTFFMIIGATVAVLMIVFPELSADFNMSIFWGWGLFLALFGSILPPFLFNYGFPKTGIGLGSILSSIEIPVSVGMALMILNEEVIASQWFGVLLIIASVVIMNYRLLQKEIGKKKVGVQKD